MGVLKFLLLLSVLLCSCEGDRRDVLPSYMSELLSEKSMVLNEYKKSGFLNGDHTSAFEVTNVKQSDFFNIIEEGNFLPKSESSIYLNKNTVDLLTWWPKDYSTHDYYFLNGDDYDVIIIFQEGKIFYCAEFW